jgi:hypothetical protein
MCSVPTHRRSSNWTCEHHQVAITPNQNRACSSSGLSINIFTGVATGAVRYSSFIVGAQIAQGFGYQGIRWTRGFTWFGPSERNTLRPRVNEVVLMCLSIRLKSRDPLRVCVFVHLRSWCLPGPFIPQGRVVTVRPHDPTDDPGAGRPLRSYDAIV